METLHMSLTDEFGTNRHAVLQNSFGSLITKGSFVLNSQPMAFSI